VAATWSRETVGPHQMRVIVRGELDLADERLFVEAVDEILSVEGVSVTLDLSQVDFIDSSGIRALLVLRRTHGSRLVVGARSDPVHRLLEISGLTALFADAENAS
jgi:anti-anti-sigma factor